MGIIRKQANFTERAYGPARRLTSVLTHTQKLHFYFTIYLSTVLINIQLHLFYFNLYVVLSPPQFMVFCAY